MPKTLREAADARKFGTTVKFANFFDEYDFNLKDIRERSSLRILEIGVQNGGSLATWKEYFNNPIVTGIDIDPACKQFEANGVNIRIGSQDNKKFLLSVEKEFGPFDIVIDDGGHTMRQQIVTFETLYPLLNEEGVFVLEDTLTSYFSKFGGRYGKTYSGIGLIKNLIDRVHYAASDSPRVNLAYNLFYRLYPNHQPKPLFPYDSSIRAINVSENITFIHKRTITERSRKVKIGAQ